MIRKKGNFYKLDTPNTTLVLKAANGSAEYVYYGKRLKSLENDYERFVFRKGLSPFSSFGEDEQRRPGISLSISDGSITARFKFKRAKFVEKPDLSPLPSSYAEGESRYASQTLCLEFTDEVTRLKLCTYYTVFADSDVISVSTSLHNSGRREVTIHSLPSLQFETLSTGYSFVNFCGWGWGNERWKKSTHLSVGMKAVNESVVGYTSHTANPFVMLEKEGSVYAFNLVYSGNHKECAETDCVGRTRMLIGINDYAFAYKLCSGESFYTPEAVMTYAEDTDGASANMHAFTATHILRGKWKNKERPVVVNNWEATYFNFNKEKLLALADEAAALGVETFVLDDGWFGKRDNDDSSLGDWFDYKEKTGGLALLADEVRGRGLKFGIWVEPEMISEKSELYEKHPEYAMKIPGREPLRHRHQLMLNFADPKVQKYIVRVISSVISECKAAYVKWDFNRFMTDPFGSEQRAGEYIHEYVKGLYTVMGKIVEKFPNVLFEGCAGGGGRYDLGILCFMPQIWTSDFTDARTRLWTQSGTSYGYPQSTMSCHVSASPNHQTGNRTPLETRFNMAAFGAFGYELDLTKLTEREKGTVKAQIAFYKKHRKLLQFGSFYRLGDAFKDNATGFICVSPDKAKAIAMLCIREKVREVEEERLCLKGLDRESTYLVSYREQDNYGDGEKFLVGGDLLEEAGLYTSELFADKDIEASANPVFTRMILLEKTRKKRV